MALYVEEANLDFTHFHCCGDEDLHPFACPRCKRLMVFCYECDTLYDNLTNTQKQDSVINHSEIEQPIFACPQCGYAFEYFFMRNPRYQVLLSQWQAAGFGHLLKGKPSVQ